MIGHLRDKRLVAGDLGIGERLGHLIEPVTDLFIIKAAPDEVASEFVQNGRRPQRTVDPGFSDGKHRVAQVRLQQDTSIQKYR